jgi:hypothetical protein
MRKPENQGTFDQRNNRSPRALRSFEIINKLENYGSSHLPVNKEKKPERTNSLTLFGMTNKIGECPSDYLL